MTGFIELQTVSGDIALIRLDQVVGIIGRDTKEEPAREPTRIDQIRWTSNRGTHVLPASVNVPETQLVTCKLRLLDGTELKVRGTARDLQAQLMLASRPAWKVLSDWLKLKSARPWQW